MTDITLRELVLTEMQAEVIAWAITKGWHGPDAPEVRFGEAIALLHSECSEALEAYRNWGLRDATGADLREGCQRCAYSGVGACDDAPHGQPKPEGVGSEFADILIRLLHYSEVFKVDLFAEYQRKMAYNHTRAFRHGGRAL